MSVPSLFSPQVGFSPPQNGQVGQSQVIIGKDVTAKWEAVGFGPDGRPDYAEKFIINFTTYDGNQSYTKAGSLVLDVADLAAIVKNNPNVPAKLTLGFKEVDVCVQDDNGNTTAQKMIVMASAPYNPPS